MSVETPDTAHTGESDPEVETEHRTVEVDPEVLAMDDALERGDHVAARELAQRLSRRGDDIGRAAGEAMLARLRPDLGVVIVLVVTGLMIVALALGYLGPRSYGGH